MFPTRCQHTPGTIAESGQLLDADLYSTCTSCRALIYSHYHDNDGDGVPRWGRWKVRPTPVGNVERPLRVKATRVA